MPALNFMERFAGGVERGKKRTTIRARRKRPIQVGDRLLLYTGMRLPRCRKLGEGVVEDVQAIRIVPGGRGRAGRVFLNGQQLPAGEMLALIRADGFGTETEFFWWFGKFEGDLISW